MSEKREVMPNTIILFENEKKTQDKHPDYTGKMHDASGKEFFVSCWVKQSAKGTEYLSGSITDADEARAKWSKNKDDGKNEKLPQTRTVTTAGGKIDDDLPF